MKSFQNFNFNAIKDVSSALKQIDDQIRVLSDYVSECEVLEEEDCAVFIENIDWLKRFYEVAECRVLDSD
jgi:uncharacterized protein YoxC